MKPGTTEMFIFPAAVVYGSVFREAIPSRTLGNILILASLVLTYVLMKREERYETT